MLFFFYAERGYFLFFFFQAEDGIRDVAVTGVQTCALPIYLGQRPLDGAPGEHAGQLTLVVGRRVDVAIGLHQLLSFRRGPRDGLVAEAFTLEDLLGRAQANRDRPRASRRQPRHRAPTPLAHDHGRDADDREVAVTPRELLERESGARRRGGQSHLGEDLVRGEVRGGGRLGEVKRLQHALALSPSRD